MLVSYFCSFCVSCALCGIKGPSWYTPRTTLMRADATARLDVLVGDRPAEGAFFEFGLDVGRGGRDGPDRAHLDGAAAAR